MCPRPRFTRGSIVFCGGTRGHHGWILDPKGVAKGTRSGPKPPLSVLSVTRSVVPTIGFSYEKLRFPWSEHDDGGGAVRRARNAPRDTSHGVEHRRAAEVKRCLKSLVASHEPLARCMLLAQVLLAFMRGQGSHPKSRSSLRERLAMQICTTKSRNEVQNGVRGS